MRNWSCHPLFKLLFKHQKCVTPKFHSKICQESENQTKKFSRKRNEQKFLSFLRYKEILKNFEFARWKLTKFLIISNNYGFIVISPKNLILPIFLDILTLWSPFEGYKCGQSHINILLVPMPWYWAKKIINWFHMKLSHIRDCYILYNFEHGEIILGAS